MATLHGGKHAHLAGCFAGFTGKMLSVEWLGHVVKRVAAEGGDAVSALKPHVQRVRHSDEHVVIGRPIAHEHRLLASVGAEQQAFVLGRIRHVDRGITPAEPRVVPRAEDEGRRGLGHGCAGR